MACECGCGYEGPDPVTEWLVVEASFAALEQFEYEARRSAADVRAGGESEAANMNRLEAMALRAIGR